jgi:hypothetical protein
MPAAQRRKPWAENISGAVVWTLNARSGHRCSDSGADRPAPRGLIFFQIFQNKCRLVNSKHMPSIAQKNPNFFMRLYWSILKNFLNCTNFKFTT